jgi:hypothetical protein
MQEETKLYTLSSSSYITVDCLTSTLRFGIRIGTEFSKNGEDAMPMIHSHSHSHSHDHDEGR